jgi:hypothetical protein
MCGHRPKDDRPHSPQHQTPHAQTLEHSAPLQHSKPSAPLEPPTNRVPHTSILMCGHRPKDDRTHPPQHQIPQAQTFNPHIKLQHQPSSLKGRDISPATNSKPPRDLSRRNLHQARSPSRNSTAAPHIFVNAAIVSGQARVFNPQSGFTQICSGLSTSNANASRPFISSWLGTRGE